MDSIILESQLEEAKRQAKRSGDPRKLADYSLIERAYKEQNEQLFVGDASFIYNISESHLSELKTKAERPDATIEDKKRYEIQLDRYKMRQAEKTAHIDFRIVKQKLRNKLTNGEVTQDDLQAAERLAMKYNSIENLALYSQIKRAVESKV